METKYRPTVTTVPTMKMRTGDFSELLSLPTPIVIYDPLSGPGARTPFPGNVIPANRLDPWAMYLMQLYPLPNAAGSLNGTAGNNAFNGPGWQHNQDGTTYERNLLVVIPGRDRKRAVLMADHYDTAYMADWYEKRQGGTGARLARARQGDRASAPPLGRRPAARRAWRRAQRSSGTPKQ